MRPYFNGPSISTPYGDTAPFPSLRTLWSLKQSHQRHNIYPTRTRFQQGAASMLVRKMYAWRGYTTESIGDAADDPNRITLAAWKFDEVVATLTLGRDSEKGLLADGLYAPELDNLRRPNRVVCEVSQLAVDPDFSSRELLSALFQAALQYGKDLFSASDVVIEVNPRHALYYQRLMRFKQIGNARQCPRVDAPAVLLHQTLDDFAIPFA